MISGRIFLFTLSKIREGKETVVPLSTVQIVVTVRNAISPAAKACAQQLSSDGASPHSLKTEQLPDGASLPVALVEILSTGGICLLLLFSKGR